MTAHDLRHPCSIWRSVGRCVDHLGRLAEILWTDCGRRDYAERFRVLAAIVVEPVNGAARNAECLSRPDVDWFSVNRPGQHSGGAVDRLLVMVVDSIGSDPGRAFSEIRGMDAISTAYG